MKAEIIVGEMSGGGGVAQYTNMQTLGSRQVASWSNTPISPNKVYAMFSDIVILTNVDPSTGQVSDVTCWRSTDGGANYTIDSNYHITRTSNSVAFNDWYSSSSHKCLWILLDE